MNWKIIQQMENGNLVYAKQVKYYPIDPEPGPPTRFGRIRKLITKLLVYHVKDGPDHYFTVIRSGDTFSIKAPAIHGSYVLRSLGPTLFREECKGIFKEFSDEILFFMGCNSIAKQL